MDLEIDLEGLKGLPLYLEQGNRNNLPRPRLQSGELVDVHTAICSSDGILAVKTLKWTYLADKGCLKLTTNTANLEANSIHLNDEGTVFNNPNRRWYVSGIIGGKLEGQRITFTPTRDLTGVSTIGDQVDLEVPYAFPWMELKTSKREFSTIVAHGEAKGKVKFKPLGSVIGYKFGNELAKGFASQIGTPAEEKNFTMQGFQVWSSAYTDQGTFSFSNKPETTPLPVWTGKNGADCYPIMEYKLKQPETISAEAGTKNAATSYSKTYYAWVMKTGNSSSPSTETDEFKTRILVRGTAKGGNQWHHDYTHLYFTSYMPKPNTQVRDHAVHHLTTAITKRVPLPIEYLTEYNLQGGGSGVVDIPNTNSSGGGGFSQSNRYSGLLRFAESHKNDESGYYNWYVASGIYDAAFNPRRKNLSTEKISVNFVEHNGGGCLLTSTLHDRYRIPRIEDWWGAVSGARAHTIHFMQNENPGSVEEFMVTGEGNRVCDLLRQTYTSKYSSPQKIASNKKVVYALRFGKHNRCTTDLSVEGERKFYTPAPDNTMLCAYRYTVLGEDVCWEGNNSKNTRLEIDVIYLGETGANMTLQELASKGDSFWKGTHSLHRALSAPGSLVSHESQTKNPSRDIRELNPGLDGYYMSLSNHDVKGSRLYRCASFYPIKSASDFHMNFASDLGVRDRSVAVRLFKKDEFLNGRKGLEECSSSLPGKKTH
ncbi:MAG: hypothetical protein Q4A64_01810 [Porphyromonadaceae bacterium]|nr:hypothetical protein [Porphyromonadaceae bacterium]